MTLSIVDLDLSQSSESMLQVLLQERNQFGCYIHYNHRLQDVMVLSDPSYLGRIQVPQKNASEEDRISITIKKLAGNDDEEAIGKE